MITADTINDEQLGALREEAIAAICKAGPYALLLPLRERPGVELLYAATYALGELDKWFVGYTIALPDGASQDEYIREGRRYCAEFLKLRAEGRIV